MQESAIKITNVTLCALCSDSLHDDSRYVK